MCQTAYIIIIILKCKLTLCNVVPTQNSPTTILQILSCTLSLTNELNYTKKFIIHIKVVEKCLRSRKACTNSKNAQKKALKPRAGLKHALCPDLYVVLKLGSNSVSTKNRFVKASIQIWTKNVLAVFFLKITHFREGANSVLANIPQVNAHPLFTVLL